MVAKKFERCDSVIELEINYQKFVCDLAKDEVVTMFYEMRTTLVEIEKLLQEKGQEALEQVKELYESMIDTFLYKGASKDIFKDNYSLGFHEDVFQYLMNEYREYRERKSLKYSVTRLRQK